MPISSADAKIAAFLGQYSKDPLGFVLAAFAWGKGELEGFEGPDEWQRDILNDIGTKLQSGAAMNSAIQEAVASGHGIGKSALVSWIILWAVTTFPDTKGVVTANTENQLKTKTWAELAKWHRLCLARNLFDCTATALISNQEGHEKTWRVDMVPWSERNTESFAGLHNKGRRVLLVFDEASAIPDIIWEVSEGALTDAETEIIWCAFGNPTRNTGRFRECFGRFRHRWNRRQIDSRTARMTNKKQLQQWVDDYGIDSDFVKVRVLGQFPSAGTDQFVPSDLVREAMGRTIDNELVQAMPVVIGVDVARFGDDRSVIAVRQGQMVYPLEKRRGIDTMTLADLAAARYFSWKAELAFVDGVGVGAGVVDRMRQLGCNVVDCQAANKAIDAAHYVNKRMEMWADMRTWLESGGSLPEDTELLDDLTAPTYHFTPDSKMALEKKEDMKKRCLASPDCADAVALTFFSQVGYHRQIPGAQKLDGFGAGYTPWSVDDDRCAGWEPFEGNGYDSRLRF